MPLVGMLNPDMGVPLDLDRFWRENAESSGKPFRTDKPRAPISLGFDEHWLFEEMRLPSTLRYYGDEEFRLSINRECNDRCQEAVGLRPFSESPAPPPVMRIEEVFGSHAELTEGGTPWLQPGVETIDEFRAKLDELEQMSDGDLLQLILSTGAKLEKGARETRAWSRGPATVATSVVGSTRLFYWIEDYPADMGRYFELFADVLIRYHRVIAAEQGTTIRGAGWLDDNCALFSPKLYAEYCLPAMRRVFAAFAPEPSDYRYQHSDSAMAHLLPLLAPLNFSAVNFGPTVPAAEIRCHMPRTEIHGQVAPFTLRNGSQKDVEAEVRRDFEAVGKDGGLVVATAGSIPAGASLEAVRGFMHAVETICRYDR